MTAVAKCAEKYFEDLNPLARKIAREQKQVSRIHEDWPRLSREEQETILDEHFITADVREKYRDLEQPEVYPSSFPRLLVNSGEKIVVDFDKECWTWRDEHSSPFSWQTRSQQDLNLWEDDDEGLGIDPVLDEEELDTSKPSVDRASYIPERPPRSKNKGSPAVARERSIWESPFLAADRGLDAGYYSSQASGSIKSALEDSEVQGLALAISGSSAGVDDECLLLDSSDTNDLAVHTSALPGVPRVLASSSLPAPSTPPPAPSTPPPTSFPPASTGHLSPVFVSDEDEPTTLFLPMPGESLTEHVYTPAGLDRGSDTGRGSVRSDTQTVVGSERGDGLLDADANNAEDPLHEEPTLGFSIKTGFDFLDNW